MKIFLFALLCLHLAPVHVRAETSRDAQVIYDFGDGDVDTVASRLGLRYEEHGMGSNRLGRGRYAFDAMVPGAGCFNGLTPAQARKWAATPRPLVLSYYSSREHISESAVSAWNEDSQHHISVATFHDGCAGLRATLFLTHGITFRSALEHFRRFAREIREFEARLEHSSRKS